MPPQKRPKSFISTAQNVVQNLIGVKDKSNSSSKCLKVYCPAKKQLLYSPSHEEVQLCHCIMQQANEFIKKELIHYLPAEPIYLNKDKQVSHDRGFQLTSFFFIFVVIAENNYVTRHFWDQLGAAFRLDPTWNWLLQA